MGLLQDKRVELPMERKSVLAFILEGSGRGKTLPAGGAFWLLWAHALHHG
jgi:hypothetical protein